MSGFLRNSDLVMFDRQTESLWQQLTGEAIVGELTGKTLRQFPAQIVSFAQFREAHPDADVLSRQTVGAVSALNADLIRDGRFVDDRISTRSS